MNLAWCRRGRRIATVTGGVGLALCAAQLLFAPLGMFHAWLFAAVFWLALSMGSAALVMIHHLSGGRWGFAIRRILEAAIAPVWIPAIAFLPLFFGLPELYPWARPGEVGADHVLAHRHPYMSVMPWILRCVAVLSIWVGMGWRLRTLSRRQDVTGTPALVSLRRFSGLALLVWILTATFAYLDWILSLEKHWYSTIFMVLVCMGGVLSALAFALVILRNIGPDTELSRFRDRGTCRFLGSLLLAFVMLWAYLMFSQFLIIWSGNLPHEISWYLQRVEQGWAWVIGAITLFHFAVPFFVLLSRQAKETLPLLARLGLIILLSHLLFDAWLVLPSARHPSAWLAAFGAVLSIGGGWMWSFFGALAALPLLPARDPRLTSGDD